MDIKQRLSDWGEWQRTLQGVGLRQSLVANYGPRGSRETGDGVRNPDAEQLDTLIANMMRKHPKWYDVLSCLYIHEYSIPHTARELRVGDTTIKKFRASAESYLDGMLAVVDSPKKDIEKMLLIGRPVFPNI